MIALSRCARGFTCAALFLLIAAIPCGALAAEDAVLPPTRSATMTLPDPAKMAAEHNGFYGYGGDRTDELPLALVFAATDGTRFASAEVNQITCRASSGDDGETGIAWLGTRLGVEAIDRATRRLNRWTRRDGLPGDYVEAVTATGQGRALRVYCLVRADSLRKLALCVLRGDAPPGASGRWTTLATLNTDLPDPVVDWKYEQDAQGSITWLPRWGLSHLALTAEGDVLVAPSAVDWRTPALVYRWNARKQALAAIPWNLALRSDSNVIGVNDLCVDTAAHRAYLATTEGLQSLDLDRPTAKWTRAFPDKQVDALLLAPDSDALYVAYRDRRASHRSTNNYPVQRPYELAVYHRWTETAQFLTPRAAPEHAADYYTEGILGVEALTQARDGAIWLTARIRSRYGSYTDWTVLGGFSRYDPATRGWTEYDLGGAKVNYNDKDRIPPYLSIPTSPEIVSDAMARTLAFDTFVGATADDSVPGTGGSGGGGVLAPSSWMENRFRLWISPADKVADIQPFDPSGEDPTDARVHWDTGGNGLSLVRHEYRTPVRDFATDRDGSIAEKPVAEQTYPFQGGVERITPNVPRLLSGTPGTNHVVVETPSGLYEIAENPDATETWKRLGESQVGFDIRNNLFRAGPDQHLYQTRGSGDTLRRYDPAIGAFVAAPTTLPYCLRFSGTTGGIWSVSNERPVSAYFVALGKAEDGSVTMSPPQEIKPEFPPELRVYKGDDTPSIFGYSGSILWFRVQIEVPTDAAPGHTWSSALIGYDAIARHWIKPLGDARTYFADGGWATPEGDFAVLQKGSVSLYRPQTETLTSVTTALPARTDVATSPAILLYLDSRAVYVADIKHLFEYDRAKQVWTSFDLPSNLVSAPAYSYMTMRIVTNNAVWVGAPQGLWRFDRASKTWQEILQPVALDTLTTPKASVATPNVAAMPNEQRTLPKPELRVAAVDAKSVWCQLETAEGRPTSPYYHHVVVRFDRATHQFTTYDAAVGTPTNDFTLRSDGDSAWVFDRANAWRLDPKTGRFVKRFEVPSASVKGATPGTLFGKVVAVAADPLDHNVAYLAIDDPQARWDIGSFIRPLYRFQKDTNTLTPLPISDRRLTALTAPLYNSDLRPAALARSTGGLFLDARHVWVGTALGVLWFDRTTGEWSVARLPEGTPPYLQATDIRAGQNGALWITGDKFRLRLAPDKPSSR